MPSDLKLRLFWDLWEGDDKRLSECANYCVTGDKVEFKLICCLHKNKTLEGRSCKSLNSAAR